MEPESQALTVEVERPEGLMKVTFVAEDELVVASERFTVNRVDYRVAIRFRREGEAWVDARDTWIRRTGMLVNDYPSDSARRKIWVAVEQVRDEILANDPTIVERARIARLRREIGHQLHKLREIEAKATEIRSGLEDLERQMREALGVALPPLDPEQCPGCGKLGDECVCGLDVEADEGPSDDRGEIEADDECVRGVPVPTADVDTSWYDDIAKEIEASVRR